MLDKVGEKAVSRPAITRVFALATMLTWMTILAIASIPKKDVTKNKDTPQSYIPINAECWGAEGPEYYDKKHLSTYTTAHISERPLMNFMRWHNAPTLDCSGIVNGYFVTWIADQRWVDRGEMRGKNSGHAQ